MNIVMVVLLWIGLILVNQSQSKYRGNLESEIINQIMRISHNGPDQDKIRLERYVDTYIKSTKLHDPITQERKAGKNYDVTE